MLSICSNKKLFHGACTKNPGSPETGSLTGMVKLEGQTDYSDISVAIYPVRYRVSSVGSESDLVVSNGVNELAELDTAIVRYNQQYPNVGIPISQATEFACPVREQIIGDSLVKKEKSSNMVYPIGEQFSNRACPPTLFGRDHRSGKVSAKAKTSSDGSFKIENISASQNCKNNA